MRAVYAFAKGSATPKATTILIQKFFYSLFIPEKPPHRGRAKFPPGIVPPAAEYR